MTGATQSCPDCGSPLRPCKCDRDEYRSPPGAIANSTLGIRKGKGLSRGKPLRSRSFEERYGDDPLRYGPLFEIVREMICFGFAGVVGHACGPGYAPASAHHLGETDLDGLIPACGRLHDRLEEFPGEIQTSSGATLEEIGRFYVVQAARILDGRDELPVEIVGALAERGVEWVG